MNKLVLVKSAPEIFLKGLNRNKFEQKLRTNISKKLSGIEHAMVVDQGRWFIQSEELDKVVERTRKVFGIKEVCVVTVVDVDLDKIKEEALNKVKESNAKTFKVVTNRANKKFPMNSMEVSRDIGGYVLSHIEDISVDIHKPECILNVEIREGNAYVFTNHDKLKGAGGLPYGMNGRTLLMLSGGIDSPVAGYMMAKRGVELNCVYYHSHPYTSERAKDKVKELAKILAGYTERINLYVVPFTDIQMQIIEKCREDELTIIMRRFMMRVACKVAEDKEIHSVATGESIGQVASQTMEGLVVSDDVSDRPVFRPLIAMDKEDIISVAEQVGTYETSILPYEDCCTIFVPKHPKTKPRLEEIRKSESVLAIDELVNKAVEDMEVFTF
ncbi:tRNA uracil 4-sulfurtransferase ThiI [Inconstantimicrobium mannanitabidum]|uniref:tRNA sulfurtransferase n=1 Tax=Inconstantimicrobium mannanitabidum TaxID=1604901 RepID=A0ACB5RDQ9_9CLOT|nr:tRNA uracil 4-sulfurtransferase ThiI [Clostridium sp. TW13]GKX66932.1 putative tRNA sulfurtransferase [Clostridium sp. TW13]